MKKYSGNKTTLEEVHLRLEKCTIPTDGSKIEKGQQQGTMDKKITKIVSMSRKNFV